jgi:predicted GIY-YIG superfamily endonuclease
VSFLPSIRVKDKNSAITSKNLRYDIKLFVIPAISKRESREMEKDYYVYILSSKRNGTLYTGITSDIIKRVYEHKNGLVEGFTKKYNIHDLVWYEMHESVESAITR